ncbi:MAG: Hsp20/alpha crystallin family protein [Candidatus Thermoplasmatota archaeon]|nr:Hsp20/alpha crystallin family protein [Candidatus Thermoplasmatota archaeon]
MADKKEKSDAPGEISRMIEQMDTRIETLRTHLDSFIGSMGGTPGRGQIRQDPVTGAPLFQGGEAVNPFFQQAGMRPQRTGTEETYEGGYVHPGFARPTNPFQSYPSVGSTFNEPQPPWGQAGQGTPEAEFEAGPGHTGERLRRQAPMPRMPAMNLCDEGEVLCVQLELPGVTKQNLDLQVGSEQIIVEGTADLDEVGEGDVLFTERVPVRYQRTIALPQRVEAKDVKAQLRNGILTVRVTKKEPTERPRSVEVA